MKRTPLKRKAPLKQGTKLSSGGGLEGSATHGAILRALRSDTQASGAPLRREQEQQHGSEHSDALRALSLMVAPRSSQTWHFPGWEGGAPRVLSGAVRRADALRGLGNAVVPQCAEVIGWVIRELEAANA